MKIRYLGDVNGVYKGPCTAWPYPLGREARVKYVDKRDVEELLKLKDADGKALFEVA